MIPKKLIFFAALILGGLAYFLKDKSLNDFQSADVQADLKKREEIKKLKADPLALEKEKLAKAKERGHKYLAGICLSKQKDGWEFTKILGVGERTYRIIDCHKYKGCTEQQDVPWTEIEFEYRHGVEVPCSR